MKNRELTIKLILNKKLIEITCQKSNQLIPCLLFNYNKQSARQAKT